MRVITRSELAHRSKYDLDAIFDLVLTEMGYAPHGSPEWQNCMISLDNIRHERVARNNIPRPRGPGF